MNASNHEGARAAAWAALRANQGHRARIALEDIHVGNETFNRILGRSTSRDLADTIGPMEDQVCHD